MIKMTKRAQLKRLEHELRVCAHNAGYAYHLHNNSHKQWDELTKKIVSEMMWLILDIDNPDDRERIGIVAAYTANIQVQSWIKGNDEAFKILG